MHLARPLTLVVTAIAALATAGTARAHVIAPGALGYFTSNQCTLNFVFDGTGPAAGRVFIGTAAHCTNELGEEVRMGADAVKTGDVVGHVVAVGPYDPAAYVPSVGDDWALIEIIPSRRGEVDPAVIGHPGFPTRIATAAEMRDGDVLQYSGHGAAAQATPTTREQRQGQWARGDDRVYDAFAPHVTYGDSGGPVVDVKTGGALGLVSSLLPGCALPCTMQGPTVSGLIAGAAGQGLTVQLRAAGQKAPARPAPASERPAPATEAPATTHERAPATLKLSAAGRRCVRAGRIALRLRSDVPLASAALTAPRRQALRARGTTRLRGLRGRRVRIAVSARTRDGRDVTARATFRAC